MDESHCLKNDKSARTKAAEPLMKSSRRLIMLSGTPALSRPMELYSQVSALQPRMFRYGMSRPRGVTTYAGFPVLGGDPLVPEPWPKNPPPPGESPPPSVPPQQNSVQGVKSPPIMGRPGGGWRGTAFKVPQNVWELPYNH